MATQDHEDKHMSDANLDIELFSNSTGSFCDHNYTIQKLQSFVKINSKGSTDIMKLEPQDLDNQISGFIKSVTCHITEKKLVRAFTLWDNHLAGNKYPVSLRIGYDFENTRNQMRMKIEDSRRNEGNKSDVIKKPKKRGRPRKIINNQNQVECMWREKLFTSTKPSVALAHFQQHCSDLIGTDTPKKLLNMLWLYNCFYFDIKRRDYHNQLCWGALRPHTDPKGKDYVKLTPQLAPAGLVDESHYHKRSTILWNTTGDPANDPILPYTVYAKLRPADMMQPTSPFYLSINDDDEFSDEPLEVDKLDSILLNMTAKFHETRGDKAQRKEDVTKISRPLSVLTKDNQHWPRKDRSKKRRLHASRSPPDKYEIVCPDVTVYSSHDDSSEYFCESSLPSASISSSAPDVEHQGLITITPIDEDSDTDKDVIFEQIHISTRGHGQVQIKKEPEISGLFENVFNEQCSSSVIPSTVTSDQGPTLYGEPKCETDEEEDISEYVSEQEQFRSDATMVKEEPRDRESEYSADSPHEAYEDAFDDHTTAMQNSDIQNKDSSSGPSMQDINAVIPCRAGEDYFENKIPAFTGIPTFVLFKQMRNIVMGKMKFHKNVNTFQQMVITAMYLRMYPTEEFVQMMFQLEPNEAMTIFTESIDAMMCTLAPKYCPKTAVEYKSSKMPLRVTDCYVDNLEITVDTVGKTGVHKYSKPIQPVRYMIGADKDGVIVFVTRGNTYTRDEILNEFTLKAAAILPLARSMKLWTNTASTDCSESSGITCCTLRRGSDGTLAPDKMLQDSASHVPIQIDSISGRLRETFRFLKSSVPDSLTKLDGMAKSIYEYTMLDKIVRCTCAMSNFVNLNSIKESDQLRIIGDIVPVAHK